MFLQEAAAMVCIWWLPKKKQSLEHNRGPALRSQRKAQNPMPTSLSPDYRVVSALSPIYSQLHLPHPEWHLLSMIRLCWQLSRPILQCEVAERFFDGHRDGLLAKALTTCPLAFSGKDDLVLATLVHEALVWVLVLHLWTYGQHEQGGG
jgi:hypothetical protein